MISQPLLATIAKFVVIGGLMAGAAGGIYAVASTRGDDSSKQSVVAATATPTSEVGTATVTAQATAAATATPPAGLTDTGYKAPDGSPLYAECVGSDPISGAKLQLPPVYPTALPPTTPINTPPPQPSRFSASTPSSAEIPNFDFDAVTPAGSSTWPRAGNPCFGLSVSAPPSWQGQPNNFRSSGYQEGTGATFISPEEGLKLQLTYSHTKSDSIANQRHPGTDPSFGNGSFLLIRDRDIAIDSAPGILVYTSERGFGRPYVHLAYVVSPKPNWYLSISAFFSQPYNEQSLREVKAFVNAMKIAK